MGSGPSRSSSPIWVAAPGPPARGRRSAIAARNAFAATGRPCRPESPLPLRDAEARAARWSRGTLDAALLPFAQAGAKCSGPSALWSGETCGCRITTTPAHNTRSAAAGGPPGARRTVRRAPFGPVLEQEQQQDDDGDDKRDDRDGTGIHENVPIVLWAPLSASRFAQYRDNAGRTR